MPQQTGPSRVTITFLLEPDQLDDAGGWAEWAAEHAGTIDPALMVVEGYRIVDGTVIISLRAEERADKLTKLFEKHEGVRHFRIRLADHGVKPNISVGEMESDEAPEYQIVRPQEYVPPERPLLSDEE